MDSMDITKNTTALDEELVNEEVKEPTVENVVPMRQPFHEWTVEGKTYKLKLTTQIIIKLEQAFNDSLLNVVLDKGIPEIRDVVAIIQGAMQKYQHGVKSATVGEIFDAYLEEGHTQIDALRDVLYPLMYDAGFFTKAQMEMMIREMTNIDSNL